MGMDADLLEHPFHTKSSGLVRHDRNNVRTDLLVFDQTVEQSHEPLCSRNRLAIELHAHELAIIIQCRCFCDRMVRRPAWQGSTQSRSPLLQILDLNARLGWLVERSIGNVFIGYRNPEARSEPQLAPIPN